ncbi:RecX family transcriptional regulator [Microbacterium sp. LRZ72]|uniref:regulatory protein RecX n=1 Tax=Microbacterium sp. LRZ72 TaxID=2942481 RepID=UPI0029A44AF3|nr:regulatory protein RecX [Microbacterium sp. LRZ72]MDX2375723.1 RecX family transcriptional regulator [Microbacterium sp. LRZ72]
MAVRFDDGDENERLAPVVPLFPGASPSPGGGDALANAEPTAERETTADVELAEKALLKKLRTRQLSVREARSMLLERAVDAESADALVADFEARGYLDDDRLAEQVVHAATTRKGQGRRAIAQALATRGIPRETVDAVLAELPDDDAERALDFARQKARSMGSLDHDAALRRLHGQLARRGFPGPVAMVAARQALADNGSSPSGVRFR